MFSIGNLKTSHKIFIVPYHMNVDSVLGRLFPNKNKKKKKDERKNRNFWLGSALPKVSFSFRGIFFAMKMSKCIVNF